ncbi:MAG TPA: hypothetical protein VL882_03325 [Vicinamibacterales bacterium]|nr:hypothetical protein [Vicinamibacterales bacterium]
MSAKSDHFHLAEYAEIATVDLVLSPQVSLCAREQNVLLSSRGGRMEVHDGFIVGIYNYCDSWCAKCRFTSRCHVFADEAKYEAAADSDLTLLREAPPHPSDVRRSNSWMEEVLSEIDEKQLEEVPQPPPLPARLMRVVALSQAYCDHAWTALDSTEHSGCLSHDDPSTIIHWFAPLIAAKTRRALKGLNEFDGDREFPPDHEGSAKIALIGIDRSMTAWADARTAGSISGEQSTRFIEELHRLCCELEELIPQARAFVRPGFDEPDEVRKLEAVDWS